MKSILTIALSFISLFGSAQDFKDGKFIDVDDTTEVVKYLNGEWKLKLEKKSYTLKFNFDTLNVTCVDSINLDWYEGTITKYQLAWDGCCRIFLNCYWFDSDSNTFQDQYYPGELWLMDKKQMIVNFGGDYGVYTLKKKRN